MKWILEMDNTFNLKDSSHIGFMVWLIRRFGFTPGLTLKRIGDGMNKRPETVRYHVVALEDMGLLEIDRRHRPHTISVNQKNWENYSRPKTTKQ